MELVRQKGPRDCGVACVAMLSGCDYQTALRRVHGKNDIERTFPSEISKALRKGKRLGRGRWMGKLSRSHFGLTKIEAALSIELETDCLLKVNLKKNKEWHWVVWDAVRGQLLDPDVSRDEQQKRRYRVTSYFPVEHKR